MKIYKPEEGQIRIHRTYRTSLQGFQDFKPLGFNGSSLCPLCQEGKIPRFLATYNKLSAITDNDGMIIHRMDVAYFKLCYDLYIASEPGCVEAIWQERDGNLV